ncbi:hypothetical protein BC829DRAFT_6419 [Chytridium lagenaria]|nr:hypothetical protein BC829DRAFT_6419 [Chytridium lagenaria]
MVLQTSILDLLLLHKIVVDTSKAMNISVDDLPDLCGERFVEIAGRLVEGRCEVEDLRKVREGGIMDVEEVRRGVKGEVRKVLSSECLKPDTIIQGCIRSIGCLGEMSKTVWECIVRMCNGINNETIKALRRDWFLRREERIMKRVVDMDVWSDIAQLR